MSMEQHKHNSKLNKGKKKLFNYVHFIKIPKNFH